MQYELFGWDLYGNTVTGEQNTGWKFIVHKGFSSSHLKRQSSSAQHRHPLIHLPWGTAEPTFSSFCCQAKECFPLSLCNNSVITEYQFNCWYSVRIYCCYWVWETTLKFTTMDSWNWNKMFCDCWEAQEVAEEKAGKIGEILDFSRSLERREWLGLYKLSGARTWPRDTGLMNRQRKGGQA